MVKKKLAFDKSGIMMDDVNVTKSVQQRIAGGPKGTRIFVKNLDTGEVKEFHNKTLISGAQWTAGMQWGLDDIITFPTYNLDMDLDKPVEELRSEIIKLNEEKTKLSEQIDFYKEMESKYKDYKETSSKEIQRLKEKNYELFERIGMVDNIEVQKAEPVKSEEELKEDALNNLLKDFL